MKDIYKWNKACENFDICSKKLKISIKRRCVFNIFIICYFSFEFSLKSLEILTWYFYLWLKTCEQNYYVHSGFTIQRCHYLLLQQIKYY